MPDCRGEPDAGPWGRLTQGVRWEPALAAGWALCHEV